MVPFQVCLDEPILSARNAFGPKITLDASGGLRAFMSACVGHPKGHLYIAAPFWSEGFLQQVSIELRGGVDYLTIFCSNPESADLVEKGGSGIAPSTPEVRVLPRLHGKLYFYRPRRGLLQLFVGSHNATCAALKSNLEFGVHMQFDPRSGEATLVEDLIQHLYRISAPPAPWKGLFWMKESTNDLA